MGSCEDKKSSQAASQCQPVAHDVSGNHTSIPLTTNDSKYAKGPVSIRAIFGPLTDFKAFGARM